MVSWVNSFNLQETETSILFKLFPSREEKGKFPNYFQKPTEHSFLDIRMGAQGKKKQLETDSCYEQKNRSSTDMEGS